MSGPGAGGSSAFCPLARAQYAAVLRMRRQMLLHSLRNARGRFELAARIFWIAFFLVVGAGVAMGCGFVAHELAAADRPRLLPLVLWPILVLWQVVPIMLASAQENLDFSFLLRFPLGFRSYLLLYLCFGVFDPASLIGGVAVLGVWVGLLTVRPELGLWFALALFAFALFNFLLTRTIFSWIERWLAKRKTREILGMVFLAVFLSFQLLNPALIGSRSRGMTLDLAGMKHAGKVAEAIQRPLPPGLAASYLEAVAKGRSTEAAGALGGIFAYIGAAGLLLGVRLRAEYRGENLGEAPRAGKRRIRKAVGSGDEAASRRWLGGPIRAVMAKDLRYLSRSGVMLFSMAAPLVIMFGLGGQVRLEHGPIAEFAFPFAVAYGFLPLTRQVCNSLGGEGAGIQLYFLSPTPFRTIMLAKNLLQAGLFLVELTLVCLIAFSKYGPPSARIALLTLCWLLFALPANLAVGNILSIAMAYRMTMTRVSREQGSVGNGLLSLLNQIVIFAAGAAVYLPLAYFGHSELAGPVLLGLAVGAVLLWLRGLGDIDRLAANRREALIASLTRQA